MEDEEEAYTSSCQLIFESCILVALGAPPPPPPDLVTLLPAATVPALVEVDPPFLLPLEVGPERSLGFTTTDVLSSFSEMGVSQPTVKGLKGG